MNIEIVTPLSWLPVYQLRGSKWWVVLDDQTYEFYIDCTLYRLIVPAGYRYDRATIWWEGVISKDSLGCQGPLVHDVICRHHGKLAIAINGDGNSDPTPAISPYRVFTRPEADDIFYAVMLADKIAKWRAWTARQFVRMGQNWRW